LGSGGIAGSGFVAVRTGRSHWRGWEGAGACNGVREVGGLAVGLLLAVRLALVAGLGLLVAIAVVSEVGLSAAVESDALLGSGGAQPETTAAKTERPSQQRRCGLLPPRFAVRRHLQHPA